MRRGHDIDARAEGCCSSRHGDQGAGRVAGRLMDARRCCDGCDEKLLVMPAAQLHGTDMLQPGVDPVAGGQVLEAFLEFLAPFGPPS